MRGGGLRRSTATGSSTAAAGCSTSSSPTCRPSGAPLTRSHIFGDHYTGEEAGKSPGFGVTLLAETTEHYNYCAEMMFSEGQLPEDLGTACSELLLEEIARGGCVDSIHQPLTLLLMAFSPEDVSRVLTGPLTPTSVGLLRLLKEMLGIVFKLRTADEEGHVLISCVGSGYKNISRKVT